jgi:hypothetical protein
MIAMADSTGVCFFAMFGYGMDGALLGKLMSSIAGAAATLPLS